MRTLDNQSGADHSFAAGLRRDIRLLARLAGMVWYYFTSGRQIRGQYRESAENRGTYWLDADDSPPPNEHWRKGAEEKNEAELST